jgi:hypothetical protein
MKKYRLSQRVIYPGLMYIKEKEIYLRLFQNFSFWNSFLGFTGKTGFLAVFSKILFQNRARLAYSQLVLEQAHLAWFFRDGNHETRSTTTVAAHNGLFFRSQTPDKNKKNLPTSRPTRHVFSIGVKTLTPERIAKIKAFKNTDFSNCPELTAEELKKMRGRGGSGILNISSRLESGSDSPGRACHIFCVNEPPGILTVILSSVFHEPVFCNSL